MTPPDLAGIVERDRKPPRCPAAADRRALLGLLRETREALEEATMWPGGGTLHHAQVGWRRVLNALSALAEP